MPVDFRTKSVAIPSGRGRRSINDSVTFGSSVKRAGISVNGFKLDYVTADHHINIVEIDTDIISVTDSTVSFRVECDFADKGLDDDYRGEVHALVIAELQ